MKINDFYKSILSLGCLTADEAGLISAEMESTKVPLVVDSKRLVLPTREHMANPNKESIVLFHPLAENIMRGESDVMAKFRSAINIKLNFTIGTMLQEIIVLATSPGMHHKLKSDQFEFLALLKEADEKTLASFQQLVKSMSIGNVDKCFVHFYIKKNAVINGKNHRRGAIITFPLYEELCKSDTMVYGIKMRKKDHASLKAMLAYIFPKIDEKDTYSRGSLSDTAPTLDALLLGVLGVASHINSMVENFEGVIEDLSEFRYEDDWVAELDNLAQFTNELRLIPMQAGNEGGVAPTPTQPTPHLQNVAAPAAPAPYQSLMQPVQSQPYMQSAPPVQNNGVAVVKTQTGGIDFAATLRSNPQFAPVGNPYGNQYAPPPPPGPVAARNGAAAWDQNRFQQPMYPQQPYYPQNNGFGNTGRI